MVNLSGKAAIVTGGSRGIGFAIARALVENGAQVVITGKTEERINAAVGQLQAVGRGDASVTGMRVDVRNHAEVDRLMNHVARQLGGLDILVNNAGLVLFRSVADMTPDD